MTDNVEILVQISEEFKKGNLNTPYFKDIPYMNDDELRCLFDFIQAVESGKKLRGKNKPSWQTDNLEDIPNTEIYQQNNQWHYHCGPYPLSSKYHAVVRLRKNLLGETSSAVIHYQKITDNHIFIIAYSPCHEPFPKASEQGNPLAERFLEESI